MKPLVCAALSLLPLTALANSLVLTSAKTDQPLTIDGQVDQHWSAASPLVIELNELPYEPVPRYEGIKETTVKLRSMYDAEYVYFLVEWTDPTQSLGRFPWIKQADGQWKLMKRPDQTGNDNTYYEDKFAFLWNINQSGFAKKGCDKSCHMAENGILEGIKDTSVGRHYTSAGQTIDIWHWKSARTNPVKQVDDQYMNSDHAQNKGWGRHSDESTGGGYRKNVNADHTAPAYMTQGQSSQPYWVLNAQKQPFTDTAIEGDIVGSMILEAATGSRGDIQGYGTWQDGVWTLEIKRTLTTHWEQSTSQDVQFTNFDKVYHFGVTAFDNAQINHLFHKKALQLRFE